MNETMELAKKDFFLSLFLFYLFFNTVNAEIFIIGYANVSDADTIKISNYKNKITWYRCPREKTTLPKTLF